MCEPCRHQCQGRMEGRRCSSAPLLEQRFPAAGKDHNTEVHTEADIQAAVHGGSHPGAGGHTMKPFQPL